MSGSRALKRFVAGTLASDPITTLLQPLARGVASILMLHRFADADRQNAGHDPDVLRSHLAYLRRMRYELVSLVELTKRLDERDHRLARTVAFTIDDGYADYATVGAPVFEEFDCPATVFVVTGATNERGWYWWDRLRVALEMAERRSLTIEVAGNPLKLTWTDATTAARAARTIVDRMKFVSDAERRRILETIPALVEAHLPAQPPPRYASMTWDEIRRCARGVTTFGAHTVTHPILSRTDDTQSRWEIEASWTQLTRETGGAIPVFCYPNGGQADLGTRETRTLSELGIQAAVTSQPGYATVAGFHSAPDARFLVPRFPYGGETTEFVQVVSGVERMKLFVRGAIGGRG